MTTTLHQSYFTANSGTPAYTLLHDTELLIDAGVMLVNSAGTGLLLGGNNQVTISGSVGGTTIGVYDPAGGSTITVNATGSISAVSVGLFLDDGSTLKNYGTIRANESTIVDSSNTPGDITIKNFGWISNGPDDGSRVIQFQYAGLHIITNSGHIESLGPGGRVLFSVDDAGIEHVTNTGTMVGAILLGGGADKYDGHLGHHTGGVIDAGAGDDSISGGSDNDTMLGGLGLDTIKGGKGHDTLAGNIASAADDGARDYFTFTATSDSGTSSSTRDVIWGTFTGGTATGDKIDLSSVATGHSGHSTFAFVGDHAFRTNHPGEVRVVASGADYLVSVNTDKDSSAEMTILVHSTSMLVKGDFVL